MIMIPYWPRVCSASGVQVKLVAVQQAIWKAAAVACVLALFSFNRTSVSLASGTFPLGPLAPTSTLVLITTPSVEEADVRGGVGGGGLTNTTQLAWSFHLLAAYPDS